MTEPIRAVPRQQADETGRRNKLNVYAKGGGKTAPLLIASRQGNPSGSETPCPDPEILDPEKTQLKRPSHGFPHRRAGTPARHALPHSWGEIGTPRKRRFSGSVAVPGGDVSIWTHCNACVTPARNPRFSNILYNIFDRRQGGAVTLAPRPAVARAGSGTRKSLKNQRLAADHISYIIGMPIALKPPDRRI